VDAGAKDGPGSSLEGLMLTITNMSKSFPGVRALSEVKLNVRAGEIHALIGENGAGKSTLTKLIAGVYRPDEGEMEFDGKVAHWSSAGDAKAAGIHVIYQEFVLFPQLTVAENIFLGNERRKRFRRVDHRQTKRDAVDILRRLGVVIDPDSRVSELSVADQQMVEIAKALVHKVKLLILDEPTAVISGKEVSLLFQRISALRAEGVAVIYISHRLEEIFEICDRVTVLKDGKFVACRDVRDVNRDQIVSLMVGRDMAELFPGKAHFREDAPVVLEVRDISVKPRVRKASLKLRAGEITTLAGMVGSGRTEVALGIFGGLPLSGGQIVIGNKTHAAMSPAQAIEEGIGLLTEDRKGQGLAMLLDVASNISASDLKSVSRGGMLDHRNEAGIAGLEIASYQIACRGPRSSVLNMSGGNQQKVLVSRWARTCKKVLILDEPTRGVDVGAKAEIYRIVRQLASSGIAVLMISSELPEVIGMSDRVIVMREGLTVGELTGGDINEEKIMQLATKDQHVEEFAL
jgi:ribose transport system ATP-binding protein/rhamnose transport system ATP-binding protein/inositol transport system ATP-binding protein